MLNHSLSKDLIVFILKHKCSFLVCSISIKKIAYQHLPKCYLYVHVTCERDCVRFVFLC